MARSTPSASAILLNYRRTRQKCGQNDNSTGRIH
jgi:hypothetical protein